MARNQRFHGERIIRSSSKQDSGVWLGGAIIKFMARGICIGTRKKMRKRPFHPQETKHHHHHHQRLNNTGMKVPPVTLQDWMMQSPRLNASVEGDPLIQGGSKPVSRRVHPSSLAGTLKNSLSKSIEGSILQESCVKFDEVKRGGDEGSLSFSTSQSTGKLKKKVSFKEPEVADVFILKNSPE